MDSASASEAESANLRPQSLTATGSYKTGATTNVSHEMISLPGDQMSSMAKLNGPNEFEEERARERAGGRRRSSIGAGLAHISRRMSSGANNER